MLHDLQRFYILKTLLSSILAMGTDIIFKLLSKYHNSRKHNSSILQLLYGKSSSIFKEITHKSWIKKPRPYTINW